jgi:hypothetical protein
VPSVEELLRYEPNLRGTDSTKLREAHGHYRAQSGSAVRNADVESGAGEVGLECIPEVVVRDKTRGEPIWAHLRRRVKAATFLCAVGLRYGEALA